MPSKILVADDEKCILDLYARIFTGKGYSLAMASSFAEASGLIETNNYDLLVTDLFFPDGLGTELVKLFEKKRAGAKALMVTGAPDADEMMAGVVVAERFPKPFEVRRFMAAVTKALNG